jgi:hypothetical protein
MRSLRTAENDFKAVEKSMKTISIEISGLPKPVKKVVKKQYPFEDYVDDMNGMKISPQQSLMNTLESNDLVTSMQTTLPSPDEIASAVNKFD